MSNHDAKTIPQADEFLSAQSRTVHGYSCATRVDVATFWNFACASPLGAWSLFIASFELKLRDIQAHFVYIILRGVTDSPGLSTTVVSGGVARGFSAPLCLTQAVPRYLLGNNTVLTRFQVSSFLRDLAALMML